MQALSLQRRFLNIHPPRPPTHPPTHHQHGPPLEPNLLWSEMGWDGSRMYGEELCGFAVLGGVGKELDSGVVVVHVHRVHLQE